MRNTASNSENAKLFPAVLSDFDSTAAVQNVSAMLLERFGGPDLPQVQERFRARELTLKEYQEIAFRDVQADRTTMRDYVKQHATLRPRFRELWDHCQNHDIPLGIVSHGMDFYIEALLETVGATHVPIYAVRAGFTPDGITYQYDHALPGQERHGNSKGLVVDQYREQGYHVVYVGDGLYDFEPASRADLVFACSYLAEECQRQDVPFRPFQDFGDVLLALKEFPLDGLRPPSGQERPS